MIWGYPCFRKPESGFQMIFFVQRFSAILAEQTPITMMLTGPARAENAEGHKGHVHTYSITHIVLLRYFD